MTGKVIPSVLSLIAAGATAWLQLRKPQQLWSMYRTAQRELEDHETKFKFQIGAYDVSQNPDKELATAVAEICLGIHYHWINIVPNPEQLKAANDLRALSHSSAVGNNNGH